MATLSQRAQKDLADLPKELREKAENVIGRLDAEPGLGKKLLGALAGKRSARLGRSYRIIYELRDDGPFILTIRIRRDVYR